MQDIEILLKKAFADEKCLVTGAAGFMGSHLVDSLLELGAIVDAVDDFTTGKDANIVHNFSNKNYKFSKIDIRKSDMVAKLISECRYIFHFAARVVAASIEDPMADMEVNIGGTVNILEACRKGKALEKIVFASSASIYGNSRYFPSNENDPVNPLSPYAVSKLAGESYVTVYYDTYGLPTTSLRFFNIFGPRQSDRGGYGGVVSIFAKRILANLPLQVYGDGTQTRDFTYIKDAIQATLLAAQSPRSVGEIFNIGTGIETSVNDLAELMKKVSNRPDLEVEHVDKRTVDNIRRRVANIEKARHLLRYEPMVTLSRGLSSIIEWYRKTT